MRYSKGYYLSPSILPLHYNQNLVCCFIHLFNYNQTDQFTEAGSKWYLAARQKFISLVAPFPFSPSLQTHFSFLSGFAYLQRQRVYSLSGQLVPVLHHLHRENFFSVYLIIISLAVTCIHCLSYSDCAIPREI